MSYLIGIDIGGTKIAAAAVSLRGELLARAEIETRAREGAARVIARLVGALHGIEQPDQLLGIGIGCTGPLDVRTGHIMNPYTLPTWDDVDIISPLAGEFGTRVILENDCDAAALGEYWVGAGAAVRVGPPTASNPLARDATSADRPGNMVYLTIGTGIGSGLVLGGKLYRGVGLTAGEIGHMSIDYDGPVCYCGARGCLELLAAGPAIAREYECKTGKAGVSARDVAAAARHGEPVALAVIVMAAHYLGVGLANLITILAPDLIVLGGGIMQHFDLFEPTLRATVAQNVAMVPWRQVRIARAALGADAGVIGAAKAFLERESDAF